MAPRSQHESFVAECFWPDVQESDIADLDRRIEQVVEGLGPSGGARFVGSMLLVEDEVVLCQFEGALDRVREIALRAAIPCQRILAAAHSPRPLPRGGTR